MKVLEVSELTTGYSGAPVVRHLSLEVDEGEIVALLGPNGAGKTTTLLTVSGLVPIMGGDITVLGVPVRGHAPHGLARLGMAHVPEERALFSQLSVRENLRLGVQRGVKAAQAIDDVLGHFSALQPLVGRKAGLLSGGEQQMLALARALVSRPRLLMVDEMSLGLAPIIVEQFLPVLSHIAAETGCGVLLVEQHVRLALQIASRAYVLAHGELVLEGPADHLMKNEDLLETSYLGQGAVDG
jgi:branched-chain amino acid transport system ATP-binding protein